MLKRTLSGSVYVILIVGFFLLRNVDARLFQIFLWFFCAMGTFEVARAEKPLLLKGLFSLSVIWGVLAVPFYCILKYVAQIDYALLVSGGVIVVFALLALCCALIKKLKVGEVFSNVLPFIYPSLSLLLTCAMNDFSGEKGFLSLLLLFVISPCSDTMAYLTGMVYNKIRKGKAKKLCPNLSPKKTIAGAIGGLFGGALSGLILYFIFEEKVLSLGLSLPLLWIMIIGFIGSVLTQIGDLFESYVKRKANLKDMGKIMPGHGGVMDRIDGMLFLSIFLVIVFAIV